MMTVFALISILRVLARNVSQRVECNTQASEENYKALTLRSHRSKKAAAFWVCVQQQHELGARPELNRPSGEIFWPDVWQDFRDERFRCHFCMHGVSL